MKFNLVGILLFFFFSSFRGKVEVNWTSPAMVSMIVLSYHYLNDHLKWRMLLVRLLPITIFLAMGARIVMLYDVLPVKKLVFRFHSWKEWPQEMKKATHGLPIVFNNSYQRAAKYWFYTGQPAYSLNYYQRRMNNYNFWPLEDSILGKPAYYLDIKSPFQFRDSIKYPLGYVVYMYDSCFASYAKIFVKPEKNKYVISADEKIPLKFHCNIPPLYSAFIRSHPPVNDTIRIGIFRGKKFLRDIYTPLRLTDINNNPDQQMNIQPALPKGHYYLRFAINTGIYTPTHNSERIPLIVR